MKKLFTIDDFMVAFISKMAYGLSFEIPKLFGWENIAPLYMDGRFLDFRNEK